MNLGAFAYVMHTGRTLDKYKGARRKHVVMGITMVVFLLSLVGIPPLAGFVGKFLLFGTAMDTGFTWVVVVAILNSVLSLTVYLRIIVLMYQQPNNNVTNTSPMPLVPWVTGITLILTLAIGLSAQLILDLVT